MREPAELEVATLRLRASFLVHRKQETCRDSMRGADVLISNRLID
jgi:hypothetical protein